MPNPKNPIPDALRKQLDHTHRGLLLVHKALIDHERTRFEHVHGPIGGPADFLQVLIHDPFFAWLRPISELAVQIDEFVYSKTPLDPAQGEALVAQAIKLLTPNESGDNFEQNYHRALQQSPEASRAHGEWKQLPVHSTPST